MNMRAFMWGGIASLVLGLGPAMAGDLGAAVSPASRAVALPSGGAATATTFATVINRTGNGLGNCEVDLPGRFRGLQLDYAWTDPATNELVPGTENLPFSLGPHASRSLVLAITADAPFNDIIPPLFSCSGASAADSLYGVNTLELVVAETAPTDILAIGIALPDNDGVIRIATEGGRQAMAIAAINIGAANVVTVQPVGMYGQNADLPADLTICETDSQSRCLSAPVGQLDISFAMNEVRTFASFIQARTGAAIPLAPASNRVEIQFRVGDQLAATTSAAITAPGPDYLISSHDALRLAQQATFGANQTLIENIRRSGVEPWLDQQLGLSVSHYDDLADDVVLFGFCNGVPQPCLLNHFTAFRLQMRFFDNAMNNDDQLRQRVAFALSQLLVVSEGGIPVNYALAEYQQALLDSSFGNYREILEGVARSPTMGVYLDSVNSRAIAPNENFPRELLQLFSLGEYRLNRDGTPVLDGQGRAVPAYTESDVNALSRALTGWIFPTLPFVTPSLRNTPLFNGNMDSLVEEHDSGPKTFLGQGMIGGQSADADLEQALDIIFNHSNVPPFVSRHLIQQLVTSNPTPQYVDRIAAVFENNGDGVRGDMRAVVRAILLDSEARDPGFNPLNAGKLREPVLLLTSALRMIGAESDGLAFLLRMDGLGQVPFESPSVFNFYPPDFALQGGGGLVSPPQGLMNMSTVFERHNILYDWTYNGSENRWDWRPYSGFPGSTGTQVDWSAWGRLAYSPERLLDTLDDLALEEDLTAQQRTAILQALEAESYWGNPLIESQRRAQLAIYLIVTSPQFQLDH
jgi:uncharacterized protein (DUF1800 family)